MLVFFIFLPFSFLSPFFLSSHPPPTPPFRVLAAPWPSCPVLVNEEGVGGALTQAESLTGLPRNSSPRPPVPAPRGGPIQAALGPPAVPTPPPEPAGRRCPGGPRTSRPQGGGGSCRVRSLTAWLGRGGVGPAPPGGHPGAVPSGAVLRGRPSPAQAGPGGVGTPRVGPGKLRGRLPPAPGSPPGSARGSGRAAPTRGG